MGSASKLVETPSGRLAESPRGGMTREWILDDESARELSQSVVGSSRKTPNPAQSERLSTPPIAKKPGESKGINRFATNDTKARTHSEDPSPSRRKLAVLVSISFVLGVGAHGLWRPHSESRPQEPSNAIVSPAAVTTEASSALDSPDSFTLAPAVAIIPCEPGATISRTFTIYNPSPRELTFEAAAQDVVLRDEKAVFARAGSLMNGIAATAVFGERFFNVKPRGSRSISVSLTVHPRTTSNGVLIQFRGTDKVPISDVSGLSPTLGSLLLLRVSDGSAADTASGSPAVTTALSTIAVSQWAINSGFESNSAGGEATGATFAGTDKGGSHP